MKRRHHKVVLEAVWLPSETASNAKIFPPRPIGGAAKCFYIATLLNNRIYLISSTSIAGDFPMMHGSLKSNRRRTAWALPVAVVAGIALCGSAQAQPAPAGRAPAAA